MVLLKQNKNTQTLIEYINSEFVDIFPLLQEFIVTAALAGS